MKRMFDDARDAYRTDHGVRRRLDDATYAYVPGTPPMGYIQDQMVSTCIVSSETSILDRRRVGRAPQSPVWPVSKTPRGLALHRAVGPNGAQYGSNTARTTTVARTASMCRGAGLDASI